MKYFVLPATAFVLGVFLLVGIPAQACNVPVFRYALERWRPDPYRVTVFHREPLTAEQQTLVNAAETFGTSPANMDVRLVDVDETMENADQALFAGQAAETLPRVVVQYPKSLRVEKPIWAGSLDAASMKQLAGSPLRTELVRRLAEGQTAVWLILECGDAAKNDAAAKQLEAELKVLSRKLELPDLTTAPEDNLLSDAPLKVAFSQLRVPRGVAAEQGLLDILLHSEADLKDYDEPMVFPVFGRGRALLPLIGAGITRDNIHDSAGFLVGACSCEIKELNPGFDLLLTADWDALLFDGAPPPAAQKTASPSGKPQYVPIPPGASKR